MPSKEQIEAAHQIIQRWKDGYVFNDDSEDDVELAALADFRLSAAEGVKPRVKPLNWIEDRDFSSYASFKFGPETVYYNLNLVDADLDLWMAETGVHCSEFGATEIHKCIGRQAAKDAVEAYHARRLAALEGE